MSLNILSYEHWQRLGPEYLPMTPKIDPKTNISTIIPHEWSRYHSNHVSSRLLCWREYIEYILLLLQVTGWWSGPRIPIFVPKMGPNQGFSLILAIEALPIMKNIYIVVHFELTRTPSYHMITSYEIVWHPGLKILVFDP